MTIIEAIRERKSCRTFRPVPLSQADRLMLEDFISRGKNLIGEEVFGLRIIEKKEEVKKMALNYGMITGHSSYLLGKSKSSADSRVMYGYMMEKAVLRATQAGIATCWIGYFDPSYFDEIICREGYEIPGIVILGYAKEKPTVTDKLARFAANASKRMNREKLFFDYPSLTPLKSDQKREYDISLEMVRLAPSAGNTQPWRIFWDGVKKEFHFFKKPVSERYEIRGLHDIDMGIALSHFELTSLYHHLAGIWLKYPKENMKSTEDLQYIMTWKCE